MFQSTHLHEVWHTGCLRNHTASMFQSTHLHEVWLSFYHEHIFHILVSIHTPTWGVTPDEVSGRWGTGVSIHTPTWGVTPLSRLMEHLNKVSIHTPTWGVTGHQQWRSIGKPGFNPHTYMRCDSIYCSYDEFKDSFNPHTYMRCDSDQLFSLPCSAMFQSTHLHEVWQLDNEIYNRYDSFNPHTYMRCDSKVMRLLLHCQCFNPHTYMRCDCRLLLQNANSYCFNPHTYMRCDLHRRCFFKNYVLFQSTHLHEVWPLSLRLKNASGSFNPHTYMRCDLPGCMTNQRLVSFNPHTYMRCDSRS